tara:strand:- start:698 stop:1246 length:549 start_codon:yes stop_codon:yes gene_type:complete
MSLKDKIKKIINVIENTDIEEIEISSFWGAQKIRLSKKSSSNQFIPLNPSIPTSQPVESPKDVSTKDKSTTDDGSLNEQEESIEGTESTQSLDVKEVIVDEELEYQKAPLVGTFYLSSKPGEAPFVNIGDKVSKGQTLCIIEAMKIFNEIESDFDGTIVEVLAEDSEPVEFNQSIFSIKESE